MNDARRTRGRPWGALAIAFFVGAVLAQSPSPIPEVAIETVAFRPEALLTANATTVPLMVVVRDSHDRIVPDLGRDDFEVLDQGAPQTLTSFAVERHEAAAAAPGSARGAASAAGQRNVALDFEDLDSSSEDMALARQAGLEFVRAPLPPGERVGVFTSSGEHVVPLTTDIASVEQAITKLTLVERLAPPCPVRLRLNPPHDPVRYDVLAYRALVQNDQSAQYVLGFYCDESCPEIKEGQKIPICWTEGQQIAGDYWPRVVAQASDILDGLDRTVNLLGRQPGERVMLLTGSGFLVPEALRDRQKQLEDDALRNSVVINTLDAAELSSDPRSVDESKAVLDELATATGGTYFHNRNNLSQGMGTLSSAPAVEYAMSFAPAHLIADGRFHTITVRLRSDSSARIQTRAGYYAPAREASPGSADLDRRLNQAALATTDTIELPATVAVTTSPAAGHVPAKVRIAIAVDARKLEWANVADRSTQVLTFAAVLSRANGSYSDGEKSTMVLRLLKTTRDRLEKTGIIGEMNLPAVAGTYRLRVVVMESVHGHIRTFSRQVAIQ